jgi:Phage head-tail joining protein
MSLPIWSTTITVQRFPADPTDDPWDEALVWSEVATGVRAHISVLSGREEVAGGSQEIVTFRLDCDPTDIFYQDRVQDETTGDIYEVEWAERRRGNLLGLEHTQAQLKQVTGIAAGMR